MIKTLRKAAVITLVFALLALAFASCTPKEEPTKSEEPAPQKTQEKVEEATEEPEVDPYEGLPKEFSVGIFDRGECATEEGTMADNRWTQWINENNPYGFTVEFLPYPRREALDKWEVELAAGTAPDVMIEYWSARMQIMATQGYLMDVTELLPKYAPDFVSAIGEDFINKYGTVDGSIYLIPTSRDVVAQDIFFVRQDWLDDLGLTAPATQQEFFDLAKAFMDADPDGQDAFGVAFNHRVINLIMAAQGIKFGEVCRDFNLLNDEIVYSHEMPGFWETVGFMRSMYEAGLVQPDFIQSGYDKECPPLAYSGRLGIFARNPGWESNLDPNTRVDFPDANWVGIPLWESTENGAHPYLEPFAASKTQGINSKAENPKAILEFLNWQADVEVATMFAYGVEGVHYEMSQGFPVDIDVELNNVQRKYMQSSTYTLYRIPGLTTPDDFRAFAAAQTDPLLEERYGKQANDISYLDTPYEWEALIVPMYLPEVAEANSELFNLLNDIVKKAIIGGADYSVEDAKAEVEAEFAVKGYPEMRVALNEWYSSNK